LMKTGIDPNLLMWATVGIVALGISAIFLPIGLHYSFHDHLQRYTAYAFYALDLGLMIFNAIADFGWNVGQTLPNWLEFYRFNVMPATPLLAAVGWSLLALMDPSQQERSAIEQLKASTRKVLRERIAQKALATNVDKVLNAAAESMAYDVIEETLGKAVDRTRRGRSKRDDLYLIARDVEPEPPKAAKAPVANIGTPLGTKPMTVFAQDTPLAIEPNEEADPNPKPRQAGG
jgi:hypothetical protein